MAELPEITKLAGQMKNTLTGKTIDTITLLQEKCANVSQIEFQDRIAGAKITDVFHRGKWIITKTDRGECILLSLGMGGDIIYFESESELPEKYQIKILHTDGSGYTARFWWFGKFLLVAEDMLLEEASIKDIAIDPFDMRFTQDYFASLLKGKKAQIKAFLMNQKKCGRYWKYVHA